MERNRLNLFSQIRRIVGQGLEHLFTTSSSSHSFNKTDLEQYLFNFVSLTGPFQYAVRKIVGKKAYP